MGNTGLGFAIAIPTLLSLIPDAVRAVLTTFGFSSRTAWEQAVSTPGTPDFVFVWIEMIAYAVGLLCLFPVAVGAAERLSRWPAIGVGVAGAIAYQGVYLIFIR